MSTILKALRRLEREKSGQPDRSLGEAVASASPPPRRRRRGRWLAVAGLLAVGVASAVVVFPMLPTRDEPEVEAEDSVAIAAEPQKAPPAHATAKRRRNTTRRPSTTAARQRERPARAKAGGGRVARRPEAEAPASLSPEALSSEVEVVERIRNAEPTPPEHPGEPSPREEEPRPEPESAQPTSASQIAAREAAPDTETPRPAAPEAPEPVQLAAATPAAKPPASPREEPQPPPLPRAAERSIRRPPVPDVYVERTIWHPMAERRVAVIELEGSGEARELHEGDVVGPLVVGKIEPSGVLFLHDGVELRRRVGVR